MAKAAVSPPSLLPPQREIPQGCGIGGVVRGWGGGQRYCDCKCKQFIFWVWDNLLNLEKRASQQKLHSCGCVRQPLSHLSWLKGTAVTYSE